ncbi:hypothetical protein BK809_0006748 [Diplodia seriata]|uniref:Uncharacterized protein n=1 Tax=Diplodia seriata TaxID=420778 RepID=A0A1S8B4Z3_9PEZI|nr:hypothetical protein BK809_0006748 [Diplodia seriata]
MIARGTAEECPGDVITLAKSVIANNGNAEYEDMLYPATFDSVASTQQGMNATKGVRRRARSRGSFSWATLRSVSPHGRGRTAPFPIPY